MDEDKVQRISTAIAEITMGSAALNALLILELDKRGVIEKLPFAEVLERQVKMLRENPHSRADGGPRHDIKLLEAVATFLRGPPPKGWVPRVIEGGKE